MKINLDSRIPTIACYSQDIISIDEIKKEQKEVKWLKLVFETRGIIGCKIIVKQHDMVLIIGNFPSFHIKVVSLCNFFVEGEVDFFVAILVNYPSSLSNNIHSSLLMLL